MAVVKFKPNVGRSQYRGSVALSSRADFGASIQAQMKVLIDNYRAFTDHVDSQSPEILKEALEPTFQKSQDRCPVDTHDMKSSGYLEVVHMRGSTTVEMGYAKGGFPEYTVYEHENLDFHHEPPTQAKWLQSALEEDAHDIPKRIELLYSYAAGLDEAGGVWHG